MKSDLAQCGEIANSIFSQHAKSILGPYGEISQSFIALHRDITKVITYVIVNNDTQEDLKNLTSGACLWLDFPVLKEIFHHVTERTYFYVRQILFCLLVCSSLLLAILDHVGWCDHKLNLFEPIQCINGGDGIRVRMQQIYISENIIGCKD